MYKKIFLAAMAMTVMAACNNDEVNESIDAPIAFDTYVGKQTRASQTTIDNLDAFGIYAYVTANSPFQLMDNEKISKNESAWTYSNIKYWPENDKVDFFAYAPYKASWTNYSSAEKAFSYSVPAEASAQEDLIAATAFGKDKTSNGGKVNLVFKHLLSRIGFSATLDKDYAPATVTVTGLEVLYKGGTIDSQSKFTFAGSGDSGDNEAGTWATSADTQLPDGATSGELISKDVVMTTSAQSLNTFNEPATATDTYLMLLPQQVEANDIQAKITYTITYTNPDAVVTNVKTIDLPAVAWIMGKAYTYNFVISQSEIIFDNITVSDWGKGSTQPTPTPVP